MFYKCVKFKFIRHAFWLIQFKLTIKKESRNDSMTQLNIFLTTADNFQYVFVLFLLWSQLKINS